MVYNYIYILIIYINYTIVIYNIYFNNLLNIYLNYIYFISLDIIIRIYVLYNNIVFVILVKNIKLINIMYGREGYYGRYLYYLTRNKIYDTNIGYYDLISCIYNYNMLF